MTSRWNGLIAFAQCSDGDFGSWIVPVQPPVDMPLLNLPVILVDSPLHQIEYQAFIQVRPTAGIVYGDVKANIALKKRRELRALTEEILGVFLSLVALDEPRFPTHQDKSPAVCLGCWLAMDNERHGVVMFFQL